MARGLAIVTSPPGQASTSNLGQAMLKRDVCLVPVSHELLVSVIAYETIPTS